LTINVTPVASQRIKDAISAEGKPGVGLRIYVEGGGCSGLQYGLEFDDAAKDGDEVVDQDGYRIMIDRFSAPYLENIKIDYVTSLQGSGFKIENPNASGSCGCGHSFKV
jgi:iron-sulfur cluster assembly protein